LEVFRLEVEFAGIFRRFGLVNLRLKQRGAQGNPAQAGLSLEDVLETYDGGDS
jgi:hypothetical protein